MNNCHPELVSGSIQQGKRALDLQSVIFLVGGGVKPLLTLIIG